MKIFSHYLLALCSIMMISMLFFSTGQAISLTEDPCNGGSCFQSGIDKDALPDEIKKTADFRASVVSFINYLLSFVGIILLIMVIYAGFLMITSAGDDKVLEKAKKMFIYAFLGIILIVLSYTIISFLAGLGKDVKTPEGTATPSVSGSGGVTNTPSPTADLSALQKAIDALKKQIEDLKNAPNPDAAKIANLEKELAALEKQMQTTSGSLQKELETLTKLFDALAAKGNLSTSEIISLKQAIDALKNRSTGNPDLEKKYNELLDLLDQLIANPNDENLIQKIKKALADLGITVGKSSEIIAKFTVSAAKKTVPTTLSVSAEKTYIRGTAQNPIANDAYVWSVITAEGQERIIGNGMQQSIELTESGNYIIKLKVQSSEANVISGEATQNFLALPAETEVSFVANGKTPEAPIAFTMTENTEGIIFSPVIIEKTGRTVSKVIWHFGNVKVESSGTKSVMYSFPKAGNYTVFVESIDNTNEIQKSKSIMLSIQDIVAYFSLTKTQYLIGESITFSGVKSKSDTGTISDFSWKFVNQKGETLSESSGANTIEKFTTPGNYTAILNVKDSKGKTASFYQNFSIISSDPIARFTTLQKTQESPATFIFDASRSSDPTDQKITYSWDFNGDGSYEKTNLSEKTIEYTFPKTGTYTVTLEVTNAFGKKNKTIQKVTVLSTLQLQIEVPAITGSIQKEISFTAKHNGAKSFEWNFNDGTGKQMTNKATEKHIFKQSGKYLVTLTAYDETNQKSVAQKMIFIGEKDSPTAVIDSITGGNVLPWVENLCGSGKHGIIVHRNETITFSAENSVNKNGVSKSLSYAWTMPENNKDATPNVLWKFAKLSENGNCEEVKLTVKDTRSQSVSASESVWVSVENSKPIIKSFTIGQPKTLNAPVSVPLRVTTSDADGGIRKYTWWANRVGGVSTEKVGLHITTQANTMLLIPPFGEDGSTNEYVMHCEIEDNNGGKTTCQESMGNYAPMSVKTLQNLSPKVTLVPDKKDIKLGDTIVYTANVKTNDGTDISTLSTYKWDFDGDNIFDDSTSVNIVSHKYTVSGKFTPRVKVTYQGLATSSTTAVVVQLTSKLPLAKIKAQRNADGSISLDGSTSEFDKTVEGNALSYLWDFNTNIDSDGDGKADNDADAASVNAIAKYESTIKRIRIKLSIKDAAGAEDTTIQSMNLEALSGIVGGVSEKQKTESKEANDVQEIIDAIKALLAEKNPSKENIQAVKDKINTLKNTSNSAKTQSQLATLEEVMKKWEQNPSDTPNALTQIDEVQKAVQETVAKTEALTGSQKEAIAKASQELSEKVKAGTVTESDIKKTEALLKEIEIEALKNKEANAPLLENIKKTKEALTRAKQNLKDPEALKKVVESMNALNTVAISGSTAGTWKTLFELGKKINRSLSFTTQNPSSVLDMYGGERTLASDEKITIFIFAKNADGSFYSGPIDIKILKGSGQLSSPQVMASSGRATVDMTALSSGELEIEATASLLSGALSETLSFTIE